MSSNRGQSASAPGKMVLIGEYAVTRGLPALSIAVNRRVTASRTSAPTQQHTISSSMLEDQFFSFDKDQNNYHWAQAPAKSVRDFVEHLPWPPTQNGVSGIALELDSKQFFMSDQGKYQKTGVGSSAALMLAACCVLNKNSERASQSHFQLQQQAGSGIDLATSLHGGLICFQQKHEVKLLTLPADFYWQAVWTGESAKTKDFLQAFNAWIKREPAQWKLKKNQAASLIAEAIRAVGNSNGIIFTACIRAYGEWLRELSDYIQMPVYTPAFEKIREMSLKTDCAWKPSGAGGGDIGIICAASRHNLTEISRTISDAGYKILDLEVDTDGLKVI